MYKKIILFIILIEIVLISITPMLSIDAMIIISIIMGICTSVITLFAVLFLIKLNRDYMLVDNHVLLLPNLDYYINIDKRLVMFNIDVKGEIAHIRMYLSIFNLFPSITKSYTCKVSDIGDVDGFRLDDVKKIVIEVMSR